MFLFVQSMRDGKFPSLCFFGSRCSPNKGDAREIFSVAYAYIYIHTLASLASSTCACKRYDIAPSHKHQAIASQTISHQRQSTSHYAISVKPQPQRQTISHSHKRRAIASSHSHKQTSIMPQRHAISHQCQTISHSHKRHDIALANQRHKRQAIAL